MLMVPKKIFTILTDVRSVDRTRQEVDERREMMNDGH